MAGRRAADTSGKGAPGLRIEKLKYEVWKVHFSSLRRWKVSYKQTCLTTVIHHELKAFTITSANARHVLFPRIREEF